MSVVLRTHQSERVRAVRHATPVRPQSDLFSSGRTPPQGPPSRGRKEKLKLCSPECVQSPRRGRESGGGKVREGELPGGTKGGVTTLTHTHTRAT
ncbi:hypothetical protein E2C01_040555 [Portunus trituberculatus]|uniref:Uncharacterized protein n=1 Tax=Portunus trituberculatus TaxID=210409 RepID=A0A5B7FMZ1_PORTR|nr:hypothetical protein [Portunus trituberculatus]